MAGGETRDQPLVWDRVMQRNNSSAQISLKTRKAEIWKKSPRQKKREKKVSPTELRRVPSFKEKRIRGKPASRRESTGSPFKRKMKISQPAGEGLKTTRGRFPSVNKEEDGPVAGWRLGRKEQGIAATGEKKFPRRKKTKKRRRTKKKDSRVQLSQRETAKKGEGLQVEEQT